MWLVLTRMLYKSNIYGVGVLIMYWLHGGIFGCGCIPWKCIGFCVHSNIMAIPMWGCIGWCFGGIVMMESIFVCLIEREFSLWLVMTMGYDVVSSLAIVCP